MSKAKTAAAAGLSVVKAIGGDAYATAISQAKARLDGYVNLITGLGTNRDKVGYSTFAPPDVISFEQAAQMYHGYDFARIGVDAIVDDALRKGYTLTRKVDDDETDDAGGADEDAETLRRLCDSMDVLGVVERTAKWGRSQGRGGILLGLDGAGSPETPYDVDANPGRLQWVESLEARDYSPYELGTDLRPAKWLLNADTVDRASVVHDSRIIEFGGIVTGRRERMRHHYADHSVLQPAIETLRDAGTNWQSFVHLLSDASQGVYKIKHLFDLITAGDTDTLHTRMELIDMSRSVARSIMVDADTEDFQRVATTFAGLPEAMDRTWQRIAAAFQMPVTRFMGISSAGLNSTGSGEADNWNNQVAAYQRLTLRSPLQDLVNLIAISNGLGDGWVVGFPPLRELSAAEQETVKTQAFARWRSGVEAGVLLAEEVAIHAYSGNPDAWTTDPTIDLELRKKLLDIETGKLEDEADNPTPDPIPPPSPFGTTDDPTPPPADDAPPSEPEDDEDDEA